MHGYDKAADGRVFVLDDDKNIQELVAEILSDKYDVATFGVAEEALEAFEADAPDAFVCDIHLGNVTGFDVLQRARELNSAVPVILVTGFGSANYAISATRQGAYDYISKPFSPEVLHSVVDAAVADRRRTARQVFIAEPGTLEEDGLIGESPRMVDIFKIVGRIAATDSPALIEGESGTGKELVARAVFRYSKRSKKLFLAVNCAALTESLLESELFGHEKGAFTGADTGRPGKFEQADGGTLFLDEIGDMPLTLQAKLLRVLEGRPFQRVGGSELVHADVRIIAATNTSLEQMVADKKFRRDLYYRLSVVLVRIPPLRKRIEDIPLLADYFRRLYNHKFNKRVRPFSPKLNLALTRCRWSGNVRELRNSIESAATLTQKDVLDVGDFSVITTAGVGEEEAPAAKPAEALPVNHVEALRKEFADSVQGLHGKAYDHFIKAAEKVLVEEALRVTNGNQSEAAILLGISRNTLRKKVSEYEVQAG